MTIKQTLTGLFVYSIIGLSIYFIVKFFYDYEFTYLICGILVPVVAMLISSQYFAGLLFSIFIVICAIVGFFYLNSPYNLIPVSLGIYLVLFKMIRISSGLSGNHIDRNILINQDFILIFRLLNSEWFKKFRDKNPFEVDLNELINQPFYKNTVVPIIETLIANNRDEFINSKFSKETLIRIHAIGILHGLPFPVIKNSESITSTGTQLLLNIFGNIESINEWKVTVDKESTYVKATYSLIDNSKQTFGEVTQEELSKIFNGRLRSVMDEGVR